MHNIFTDRSWPIVDFRQGRRQLVGLKTLTFHLRAALMTIQSPVVVWEEIIHVSWTHDLNQAISFVIGHYVKPNRESKSTVWLSSSHIRLPVLDAWLHTVGVKINRTNEESSLASRGQICARKKPANHKNSLAASQYQRSVEIEEDDEHRWVGTE